MKAAMLVGARTFEIRDLPEPNVPDDGLLLELRACGICGSDLRRWTEGPPPGSGGMIPGHEAAGVVVEVGKNVRDFAVGDCLAIAPDIHCGHCYYCRRSRFNLCDDLRLVGITPGYPGGFSERMVLTGEILVNGIAHRMPDGMAFPAAALAEPCSSVLAAHEKAGTSVKDTVVVLGGGSMGCLHALIARARGATIIISEPNPWRRERIARLRFDFILDPSAEDVTASVRQLSNGLGADIVICANPVPATQSQAVEMVRKGGRVILFGGLPKGNSMVTFDANRIHYGEIEVVGAFSYHPSFHELALELLYRGSLAADRLITHTFPLERISEAFEMAASGQGLKVMIMTEELVAE